MHILVQPLATMLICERSANIRTSTKGGATVVQTAVREDRLTAADPLGPVDPLQNVRRLGVGPSLTSEGLGWRGIKAERYHYSLREIEQPPFENHLITYIVEPFRSEWHRDGGLLIGCQYFSRPLLNNLFAQGFAHV